MYFIVQKPICSKFILITVSPALLSLLKTVSELEMSIGQLNSTDILSLNIDDQVFTPDMSTFSYNTSVSCPDGSVEEELLCGRSLKTKADIIIILFDIQTVFLGFDLKI